MSVVFSAGQVGRRKQYAIVTKIIGGDQKKVIKEACSTASVAHIKKLASNHDLLKKTFSKAPALSIAPVEVNDGKATFPLIEGRSLERQLLDNILNHQEEAAIAILDRLLGYLDLLETVTVNPSEHSGFVEVFGGQAYVDDCLCYQWGPIDLNLDNFIVKGRSWTVIDYEWLFNFPVPKDYIVGRIFYYFFSLKYHLAMSYLASPGTPMVKLTEGFLIPEYIYSHFQKNLVNLSSAMLAESNFQEYVTGEANDHIRQTLSATQRIDWSPPTLVDSFFHQRDEVERLTASLRQREEQLSVLDGQLQAIRKSRSWKAVQKILRVTRKLTD